ncbi:MAG: SulA-like leucine-rich domain-containing protein [Pseudomonas sp.]
MLYSRHHRTDSNIVQSELFHNALMASRYALPEQRKRTTSATPETKLESGYSEIALSGAPSQCLQWLAPLLRDLSQAEAPGWLTLLDPPQAVSAQWLRKSGLDPERILIVRSKSGMDSLELCCELLRLGCSHTVVSWLADDSRTSLQSNRLTRAAAQGQCRSLNIRLDVCVAA